MRLRVLWSGGILVDAASVSPQIKCKKCSHVVCKKRDMDHHMVTAHGAKPKFE